MINFDYDLFVIGTGEAGSTAAKICRAAGWNVAIADDNPFGGTCSLRGCNPKRLLAGAAELISRSRGMQSKGIRGSLSIEWNDLFEFKNELIKSIPEMHEKEFSDLGIDAFHGFVTFTDTQELSLEGKRISAKNIIIASGSKPGKIGIPGEEFMVTSDQLLSMQKLPSRILFVGAGYISMEFSHILAALGKQVTLLEYASSPLMSFDRDLVSMLVDESKRIGIKVICNCKVMAIKKTDHGFVVQSEGGVEENYETDLVVHGAGRIPNTEDLQLSKADINHERYRIKVNTHLQSISNKHVYVAGDAHSEGIQLTPVAEMEGRVVAHNLLYGNEIAPDYTAIPSVVFTFPSLASVGKIADAAHLHGNAEVVFHDTSKKHITWRLGMSVSAFKIIVDKLTNQILGAHMLGHNVDETINLFADAIVSGKTVNALKNMSWTFPSVTYDTISRL